MLYSLQIGRGIASLGVVLFHLGGLLSLDKYFGYSIFNNLFAFGNMGVIFFFILSGFIIYYIHSVDLSKPNRLVNYLKKRIVRIYPVYWIIFILVICGAYLSTSLRSTIPNDFLIVLKSLTLFPIDPQTSDFGRAPVLAVAWTLQYEMVFYFLFGLLILNKNFIYPMIGIYLYLYFNEFNNFYINFITNDIFLLFVMGVIVANFSKKEISKKVVKIIVYLSLLILLIIIVLTQLSFIDLKNHIILLGVVFSFLMFGLIKLETNGFDFKKFNFLNLLGDISYTMYLIHYPLVSLLLKVFVFIGLNKLGFIGAILAFLSVIIIVIVVSIFFYRTIERPLVKYLNRKFK